MKLVQESRIKTIAKVDEDVVMKDVNEAMKKSEEPK